MRSGQSGAAAVRATVDELDLGWRSKDRRSHLLFAYKVCKRGLIYVLAFFGIIAVGCLSGLPSATCFALQDAYTIALKFIGGLIGGSTILAYLFISAAEQAIRRGEISSKRSTFSFGCGLALFIFLYILAISFLTGRGVQNVGTAIEWCRSGEHLHDKADLYRGIIGAPR